MKGLFNFLIFATSLTAIELHAEVIIDDFSQGAMDVYQVSNAWGYREGNLRQTYIGEGTVGDGRTISATFGHLFGGGRKEEAIVNTTLGHLSSAAYNSSNGATIVDYGSWGGLSPIGLDATGFTAFNIDFLSTLNTQVYSYVGSSTGDAFWSGWIDVPDSTVPFSFEISAEDLRLEEAGNLTLDNIRFYFNTNVNGQQITDRIVMHNGHLAVPAPSTLILLCLGTFGIMTLRKQ